MNIPVTLSTYFARQFVIWFIAVMGGLLSVVYVGETLELLRRATAHPDIPFNLILSMSSLKIAGTMQVIFPSSVLFTALYAFWRLTRSHELEVTRAAGVSVWSFTAPIVLAAVALGILHVTVINPMGAAMASRFERLEDRYFKNRNSTFEISKGGLWISQADTKATAFIHAEAVKPGTFELQNVIVFLNPHDIRTSTRIDAASAILTTGEWVLTNAWIKTGDKPSRHEMLASLPTDLTEARIQESFASPQTVSFWELPKFIRTLEAAGLSSLRHRLFYESLLARPLLLAAMVLIAAVFGLRQSRQGGVFAMITTGLVLGLLMFVGNDIIQTFAQTGGIPVGLAAWGPAIVGLLAASAALFHFEDG